MDNRYCKIGAIFSLGALRVAGARASAGPAGVSGVSYVDDVREIAGHLDALLGDKGS
ncbi:hypothetical protein [Micromonospora sp. CA-246542]|uniref:hypothetical protein n=1 Tax=Micromonospora sp. CA-246542 TaxID=3239959 RepID=UPI003D9449A5